VQFQAVGQWVQKYCHIWISQGYEKENISERVEYSKKKWDI
jgi:hypothetical protein